MSDSIPITEPLQEAILAVLRAIRGPQGCDESYTARIELPKVYLADALLRALCLPTEPAPGSIGDVRPTRRRAISFVVRARILVRDGFRCLKCGTDDEAALTIDHKVPLAAGGTDDESNLQTYCRRCNSSKGARLDA